MRLSRTGLEQLLVKNVAEIKFIRRHEKLGWPINRRMLCTLNVNILNSAEGKYALNFSPAKQSPPYDPKLFNLVCAWDIFMQDWRMIPADATYVVRVINQDEFWPFFSDVLSGMSAADKERFMKT